MRVPRSFVVSSPVVAVLLSLTMMCTNPAQAQADPPPGPSEGVLGCCLPSLVCVNLELIDCIAAGGIRQPRMCSGASCGACCTPQGCFDAVVEAVCELDFGGEYGGDLSDCDTFCLPGACCLPGGTCEVAMSGLDCSAQGGVFQGIGSTCSGVICRGCGVLGTVDTTRAVLDLAVSGTLVYVATGNDGVFVIDVSNPITPVIIGAVDPGTASGIVVSGSMAYVADSVFDGMHVIDVSDPTTPSLVGSVETTGEFDERLAVSGTIVYGPDSFFLHVIDVSDPANPTVVGSVVTDLASSVAVSGTIAYVGENAGLRVIDVSNPMNPTVLGSVATPGAVRDVAVSGTLAYLADGSGLHVIDVSDPSNPTLHGFVSTPGTAFAVSLTGTVAYVADDDGGVQVIDVSDPSNPVILSSILLPDAALGVNVSGSLAYVAESSGLTVVNASSCGRGACCLTDGCLVTSPDACAGVLGTYLGDGTTCASANCPPGCAADISGDGVIGFADILEVLRGWGPCPQANP